jgi:hypothetical protein
MIIQLDKSLKIELIESLRRGYLDMDNIDRLLRGKVSIPIENWLLLSLTRSPERIRETMQEEQKE